MERLSRKSAAVRLFGAATRTLLAVYISCFVSVAVADHAVNRFAWELHNKVGQMQFKQNSVRVWNTNTVLSPLGLWSAVSMMTDLAGDDCRTKNVSIIGAKDSIELRRALDYSNSSNFSSSGVAASVITEAFASQRCILRNTTSPCSHRISAIYHTAPIAINLGKESASSEINQIFVEKSIGRVQNVVNSATLRAVHETMMVTAVSFSGGWKYIFPKHIEAPFHASFNRQTANGVTVSRVNRNYVTYCSLEVEQWPSTSRFGHMIANVNGNKVEVLEIPLAEDGSNVVFFRPVVSTVVGDMEAEPFALQHFENEWAKDAELLNKLLMQMDQEKGAQRENTSLHVTIPIFTMERVTSIKRALEHIGLAVSTCELKGVCTAPKETVRISDVVQNMRIELDMSGINTGKGKWTRTNRSSSSIGNDGGASAIMTVEANINSSFLFQVRVKPTVDRQPAGTRQDELVYLQGSVPDVKMLQKASSNDNPFEPAF